MPRENTFATVTHEDFRKVLKADKGWTESIVGGEYVYDWTPDSYRENYPHIVIRVYSSVRTDDGVGRDKGKDAIRVCAVDLMLDQGLLKYPHVKRIQTWATNLVKRVRLAVKELPSRLRRHTRLRAAVSTTAAVTETPVDTVSTETPIDAGFCFECDCALYEGEGTVMGRHTYCADHVPNKDATVEGDDADDDACELPSPLSILDSEGEPCKKCKGTGAWVNPNNPSDKRPCFTCNSKGRITAADKERNTQFFRDRAKRA